MTETETKSVSNAPAPADDALTVCAIAVIAACVSAFAHEAAGHGVPCLAMGGRITQLTSVYFHCEPHNPWSTVGGPAGNLVAFALSWAGLRLLLLGRPGARLLLLATMSFSLFWAAGYLVESMLVMDGDYVFAARDLIGRDPNLWRWPGVLVGAVLYLAAIRFTAREALRFGEAGRANRLLRLSWLAGSLSAVAAAAFYAPDRLGAIGQAALEIGAASLGMLIPLRPYQAPVAETPIRRSWAWVLAGAAVLAVFTASLGRGI